MYKKLKANGQCLPHLQDLVNYQQVKNKIKEW